MSDKAEEMDTIEEETGTVADGHMNAQNPSADTQAPEAAKPHFDTAGQSNLPQDEIERLTQDLIAAFKTVYDPEIPVDIYELGLIYKVEIDDDRKVTVDMTLTAPGCPVAGEMPGWVEYAAGSVEGVREVEVKMVFDPPWTPDRMSEEAQVALNWW